MKFLLAFLILIGTNAFAAKTASSFRNENLNPVIEKPQMPGTPTPVKEMRKAPNPTPEANESEKFRGALVEKEDLVEKRIKKNQQRDKGNKIKNPAGEKNSKTYKEDL